MLRRLILITLPIAAFGQTQVDLHTQSKSVDFTSAIFTRPVKTGTTLPGSCTTGDLFFNTAAPAGSNLYGCVSANTFVLLSGGSGGGGSVVWQTGGTTTATGSQANFVAGSGILLAGSAVGPGYQLQASADLSFLQSRGTAQLGTSTTLSETSSSPSAYTTTTNPVFSTLPSGAGQMPLWTWKVGTGCSGAGMTMQVNALPATPAPVVNADGSIPSAAQCASGQRLIVTYDSAANSFIILGGEAPVQAPTAGEAYWPMGVVSTGNWANGQLVAAQGSANTGAAYIASCSNAAGCYSSSLRFFVQTAAASGKGIQWGLYSPDLTQQWCVSAVANGSTITSTGWKSVTWAGGSRVNGGACVVPPGGYEIVMSSDDTSVRVGANSDIGQASGLSAGTTSNQTCSVGSACRCGSSASAISTGSGSGVALAANLSGVNWVALNAAYNVPAVILQH